jgi:hypothetical protein
LAPWQRLLPEELHCSSDPDSQTAVIVTLHLAAWMTEAGGVVPAVEAPADTEAAKAQVEQALQSLIAAKVATSRLEIDFPDRSVAETAIALDKFLEDLVQTAGRSADRENLGSVDPRHVKESARELHVRKKADWIRAFGMFFLGIAVSQWIRMQSMTPAPSLTDANILAMLVILAMAFLIPAAMKEKPWSIATARLGRSSNRRERP